MKLWCRRRRRSFGLALREGSEVLQHGFIYIRVTIPRRIIAKRASCLLQTYLLKMFGSTLASLLTVALAFTSTALGAPVVEERQFSWSGYDWTKGVGSSTGSAVSSGGCPSYEVISARGTTESQFAPYGNTATVNGIINAVGGNSARYEVVYAGELLGQGSRLSNSVTHFIDTADTNFATGPAIGAADLVRHVKNRLVTCPNTKFVLIGYSQGAMVTGKLLGAFRRTAVSQRWALRKSDRREQLSIASKFYCCSNPLRKVRIHQVYCRCDYLKLSSFPRLAAPTGFPVDLKTRVPPPLASEMLPPCVSGHPPLTSPSPRTS